MTIKSEYLDKLLADFELLSELVLSQIDMTRTLFSQEKSNAVSDDILYQTIEKNELLIDGLDLKIREEVINAIFLFTPRASVLRKIIAYHDMTNYLERVGDLILNISHFIRRFEPISFPIDPVQQKLNDMFKHAQTMVKNAVISFTCEDNSIAYQTIATDNKVDALYKDVTRALSASFKDKALSEADLLNLMYLNSISYNIERIADNATNIAESTVYLVEGKDIRHKG